MRSQTHDNLSLERVNIFKNVRHCLCLHALEYPEYEAYPDFDHVWDKVIT